MKKGWRETEISIKFLRENKENKRIVGEQEGGSGKERGEKVEEVKAGGKERIRSINRIRPSKRNSPPGLKPSARP